MSTVRPYSLLEPAKVGQYGPRDDYRLATAGDWWNAAAIVRKISGPVVVDFETTGLDMLAPDFKVVGIGISGKGLEGGIYFSLKGGESPIQLLKALCGRELIAHNVCYDAGVLERMIRDHNLPTTLSEAWPWKWDTISMYFHLSQHEWPQQRYGLKVAQVDVLRWEDKGDVKLDAWLSEHGLGKGDMSQAPDEILGEYGCYDVQSTFQLYEHLLPQLQKFPDAVEFISEVEVPYHYRAIVEMRFAGMQMDVPRLTKLQSSLQAEVDAFRSQFMNHEQVTPWVYAIDNLKIEELRASQPPKHTKTQDGPSGTRNLTDLFVRLG
jgi:DNA polymerase I-like protein with 3'-5' exonuclease and polymerase domains